MHDEGLVIQLRASIDNEVPVLLEATALRLSLSAMLKDCVDLEAFKSSRSFQAVVLQLTTARMNYCRRS